MLPTHVTLVEVGPRDGLQNEAAQVPAADKIELVHRLQDAGCREIEVTSYVSPKWVPQMADAADVMAGIRRASGVRYSVLTPNMKGLEAALTGRPDEIVVFGAASEAFSKANINCSIEESVERFRPVVAAGLGAGGKGRCAGSCGAMLHLCQKGSCTVPIRSPKKYLLDRHIDLCSCCKHRLLFVSPSSYVP